MDHLLDDVEMARWVAWKRAADTVMRNVVDEISTATGLSGAGFAVLTRVVEEGGGRLRQQRLSDDLGWERSRLSRQVGRMADRGLVVREGSSAERLVAATPKGRRVAAQARVAHAAAVRRHLLEPVAPRGAAAFWRAVEALGEPTAER